MIVVDTSVWIDHFRTGIQELNTALADAQVLQHPMVTLELALGSLKQRKLVVSSVSHLPQLEELANPLLADFIDANALSGTGIGLVDAHLLAATKHADAKIWTRDKKLLAQATRLACAHIE